MKLKTFGLALVATAFMAGQALAQAGTMQPIPNPPEKAMKGHMKHHKMMHHMAKKDDDAAKDKAEAKPAMPADAAKPMAKGSMAKKPMAEKPMPKK